MNAEKTAIKRLLCLAIVLSALLIMMRSSYLFLDFNMVLQHFLTPSSEPFLLSAILLATAALLLFSLLFCKKSTFCAENNLQIRLFSRIFLALSAIITSSYGAVYALKNAANKPELFLALLSYGLFFILGFLAVARAFGYLEKTDSRLIYGSVSALAPVLYAMYLYFEAYHFMNNPNILILEAALLVYALYVLQKTRADVEKTVGAFYYIFTALSVLLLLTASVPSLLYAFIKGKILTVNIFMDVFMLVAAAEVIVDVLSSAYGEKEDIS